MSHIAVDLKVIEVHAPAVARGAGVSEDRVLAGLVRLWHRCWSTKAVAVTEVEIAGAFGPERLGELIRSMETEFLRKQPDGTFHVCGADQYLRIREGHSKGGHASKSNLIPGGKKRSAPAERQPKNSRDQAETPPRQSSALPPSTEHRAPNTEQKTAPASRSPHPDHQSTVAALMAAFRAANGADYPFGPRDGKAVKEMLAVSGQPEILAAWSKALGSSEWPTVRTLPELGKHLAHFIAKPKGDWRDRVDHSKGFWGEDLPPESEPS